MQFWSPEDANARLSHTFIQLEGEWIYVRAVREDWTMSYFTLVNSREELSRNIRSLTIRNPDVQLGWCILDGRMFYAERHIPQGQNRQMGLRPRNVTLARAGSTNFETDLSGYRLDAALLPLLKGLHKTISHHRAQGLNEFPLNRAFAVTQATLTSWRLHHKKEPVGEVDFNEKRFTLYPSQFHLKEALERHLTASNQGDYSVVCYE